ncbi:MAG: hypothetical protein COB69_07195 [Phycisphaera sp.]|nr:MAG: hypothetical protein COB69_07195 [Phycisphaera sp.]
MQNLTMAQNPRPVRLGAAPERLLIIAVILLAQGLVVGMGWWSGSRNLLTEVIDEYTRRVEAAAQDTASGVALAIAKLDVDSIEPGTPGGDRVQAMLDSLELPGESVISVLAEDGQEMYQSGIIESSTPTYSASAPLKRFNATLTVRSESKQMLLARDAATSAINLRVLLGGVAIIMLTGVVAIALIALHERRLIRANTLLGKAYKKQSASLLIAREGMILGLAKLADYRDTDTGQHLDRISEYSAILATEASKEYPELDSYCIDSLRLASSLHDIGKVGIPDSILLKPGALTPTERLLINQHTTFGADTLKSIHERYGNDELLDMSIDIAIAHHERWDGTGYPNNLKEEDIPLTARIVSIADVYDALTSVRVYKDAMSHEKAVGILREGRGTQFDPNLLDAFLRVADEFDKIRFSMQPNYSILAAKAAA